MDNQITIDKIFLGNKSFCKDYNTKYTYMAGGMANAISSESLVIALGEVGCIGSFGTGGLSLERIEGAIKTIQHKLPNGPYCFNLLSSHGIGDLEENTINLYLKYGIKLIEAAAYISLSPELVYYRLKGLRKDENGKVNIQNKIIAKISRREVAEKFMSPAPSKIVNRLLSEGLITEEQSELAKDIPMADDITVEADSGGHTDNRPLISLLPSLIAIRDQYQEEYNYEKKIRIGAGGGISTPQSMIAAYMMGADYVVTGSINQACLESGTSRYVKQILAETEMADIMMTPSADMFEQGGKVQVLKKGTMFGLNSKKLYEYYSKYKSIEDIPEKDRTRIEKMILKKDINFIWDETKTFFENRDKKTLEKALKNPKKKMALIFRWYLGQSSRWAVKGVEDRKVDYQIWCGQSMGAFNNWAVGSKFEDYNNRKVAEVALSLIEESKKELYERFKLITG